MLNQLFFAAPLLLLAAGSADTPAPPSQPLDWQNAVQRAEGLVVHVPRVTVTSTTIITRSTPLPLPPTRMRSSLPLIEKKADDCIKVESIRGFSVSTRDSVDIMMRDGKLLRAKLGKDCPAIGFYSGFYIKANPDKKMCAGRDSIRSRSGRLCSVQAFRKLVVDD